MCKVTLYPAKGGIRGSRNGIIPDFSIQFNGIIPDFKVRFDGIIPDIFLYVEKKVVFLHLLNRDFKVRLLLDLALIIYCFSIFYKL